MDVFSKTAFAGYVVGGLIGGIISIVCERLWRLHENRVRLDVTISSYSDQSRADLCINFINKGSNQLPPAQLVLWVELTKDQQWSERGFEPHRNTQQPGWWPLQQKAFVKNLTRNNERNPELKQFFDDYAVPHKVELVLKMDGGSGKSIWKSAEMGESVLAHLRAAQIQGKFPEGVPNRRHLRYQTWGELVRRLLRIRSD